MFGKLKLKGVVEGLMNKVTDKVPWFDKAAEEDEADPDEVLVEGIKHVRDMSQKELKTNLAARGLKTTGLKTQLQNRLQLYVDSKRESSLAYMAGDDAKRRADINKEESGSVYACGANHRGQLGMGDRRPREQFTVIPELKGKAADIVVAGTDYVVAVTEDSEVYTWGGGGFGPLGHPKVRPPDTDDEDEMEAYLEMKEARKVEFRDAHLRPRFVEKLRGEGIVDADAGFGHVAVVSDAGDVWTWGLGLAAQLGHGGLENTDEPKMIEILQEKVIVSVAVGHSHTMCISDEDTPYAWGFTSGGRLGLGTKEREDPNPHMRAYFPSPTLVPFFRPPKKVLQLACSANHTLALVRDRNQVYAWGTGDGGRLGLGDTASRELPTPIPEFRGTHVMQVACGPFHSAAISMRVPMLDCGAVYTWGSGHYGQLGQEGKVQSLSPAPVNELLKLSVSAKAISLGTHHCAALSSDNVMYTWGSNKYGCLGADFEDEYTSTPQRVWAFDVMINGVGRGTPRSIACGHDFTAVATFPYVGPTEEELIEMEAEALHDVQKVAIKEAEREIKKQVIQEQKKDEDRKRAGKHLLEAKPLCDLCMVCPGFEPNLFKPTVCKECSHLKIKHNREHVADEDLLNPDDW